MKTLNLGCGKSKIAGADNVDVNPEVKPDLSFDLCVRFPIQDEVYDEVYFFHCIEHIEKYKQPFVLREIHRVMKMDGILYVSYPEFEEIIKHWLANTNNDRKYWEATVYGRQHYKGDYHYSAMNTLELKELMANVGFEVLNTFKEPSQEFNTVMVLSRGVATPTYEEVLFREVYR